MINLFEKNMHHVKSFPSNYGITLLIRKRTDRTCTGKRKPIPLPYQLPKIAQLVTSCLSTSQHLKKIEAPGTSFSKRLKVGQESSDECKKAVSKKFSMYYSSDDC